MSGSETDHWARLEAAVSKLNKECAQFTAHHHNMLQLNLSLTSLIDDFSRVHQNMRSASSGKPQNVRYVDVEKES